MEPFEQDPFDSSLLPFPLLAKNMAGIPEGARPSIERCLVICGQRATSEQLADM